MNRVQKVQHQNKIIVKSDLEAEDADTNSKWAINYIQFSFNNQIERRSNYTVHKSKPIIDLAATESQSEKNRRVLVSLALNFLSGQTDNSQKPI